MLRVRGPGPFLATLATWSRGLPGSRSAELTAYLDHNAAADAAFDAAAGVRTGGMQPLYDLTIASENARFGITHIASDPAELGRAMARIDVNLAGATFIDFGSDRGRLLIMAAMLPFRQSHRHRVCSRTASGLHRDHPAGWQLLEAGAGPAPFGPPSN